MAGDFLLKSGLKKVEIVGFCMKGAIWLATVAIYQNQNAIVPFDGISGIQLYDMLDTQCKFQRHFAKLDDLKGFSNVKATEKCFKVVKASNLGVELLWDG